MFSLSFRNMVLIGVYMYLWIFWSDILWRKKFPLTARYTDCTQIIQGCWEYGESIPSKTKLIFLLCT
jgi:hypothetical protein